MTKSLYSKFILGYLLFGLLGFITIATFSSQVTHMYLVEKTSSAMYDEANLLASAYSDIYQGKNVSLTAAKPQLEAVATYLDVQACRNLAGGPCRNAHCSLRSHGDWQQVLYDR